MILEQAEDADPTFGRGNRETDTSLGLARGMFSRLSSRFLQYKKVTFTTIYIAGKRPNRSRPPPPVDTNTVPRAWSSGRQRGRASTTLSEKGKEEAVASSNIAHQTEPVVSSSYNRSSRTRALAQQREIQVSD